MTARKPLPRELPIPFSTAAAHALGVPDSRLRAADLAAPFHGVRWEPDPPDEWLHRLRSLMAAFATRMSDRMFFTHGGALVLDEVPVPHRLRTNLDVPVGVCWPTRAAKGRGVAGSQLRPHLVWIDVRHGMRVTSSATTWASLGTRLGRRDLVALGDAIVRIDRMPGSGRVLRPARATPDDLLAVLRRGRWPGAPALRAALAEVRIGAASPPESHLRLTIVDARLPEPVLDHDVRDAEGRFLGCSELAYPAFRVAVEYEGDHHRTDRRQWHRDIEKYGSYSNAGWSVVRITSQHLYPHGARAARLVGDALLRAGWRPR